MSDDRSTFETTRARLEDIVVQVRRKDVSLEQSLDMLEEAVRLVNQCNELIDQTSFRAPAPAAEDEAVAPQEAEAPAVAAAPAERGETETRSPAADAATESDDGVADDGEDASVDVVVVESFEMLELDGEDIASIEFFEDTIDSGAQAAPEIEDDERS